MPLDVELEDIECSVKYKEQEQILFEVVLHRGVLGCDPSAEKEYLEIVGALEIVVCDIYEIILTVEENDRIDDEHYRVSDKDDFENVFLEKYEDGVVCYIEGKYCPYEPGVVEFDLEVEIAVEDGFCKNEYERR